jgi:hypothetical protein
LYIVYLILYFISPEFTASTNAWSLSTYKSHAAMLRTAAAQKILSGSARDSTEECKTWAVILTSSWSRDASTFPNMSAELRNADVVLLRLHATVVWDADATEKIREAKDIIESCISRWRMAVSITSRDSVVGFEEAAFVSESGKVPPAVTRGRAIAAGIFWAGVFHAFKVDSIPMVTASVIKENAQLSSISMNCWDVHWSCHIRKNDAIEGAENANSTHPIE